MALLLVSLYLTFILFLYCYYTVSSRWGGGGTRAQGLCFKTHSHTRLRGWPSFPPSPVDIDTYHICKYIARWWSLTVFGQVVDALCKLPFKGITRERILHALAHKGYKKKGEFEHELRVVYELVQGNKLHKERLRVSETGL